MSKSRFECRLVILKKLTQMTPGSQTLTNATYLNEKCLIKSLKINLFKCG